MSKTIAILSLLHEPANQNSATRLFRTRPVLGWTVDRVRQARAVDDIVLLCWEDQSEAIRSTINLPLHNLGQRQRLLEIESIAAAQRWANGWRGGLMDSCDLDAGYHAAAIRDIVAENQADFALLVSPASGLVDGQLLDQLIAHAHEHQTDYTFTAAAPGLSGMVLRRALVEQLHASRLHPGKLLHYLPDQAMQDPITGTAYCAAPLATVRTLDRFKLDSDRQVARLTAALHSLNGQLMKSQAESIVAAAAQVPANLNAPRELTLELCTQRLTRPIFNPLASQAVTREPLTLDLARKIFAEIGQVDDIRLTLAGVGDPLCHPEFAAIVDLAHEQGVRAIHVETDLVDLTPAAAQALVSGKVDVITVDVPAMQVGTYARVMGVDRMGQVLANIRALVAWRAQGGRGVPLIVPRFMKCRQNLDEMEPWYDAWLRALQCAVIAGPSDFAGQIPGVACVDMAPPARRDCWRIGGRINVLCDGTATMCEEDFAGRVPMGNVHQQSLGDVWRQAFAPLQAAHAHGRFSLNVLCGNCREWHRP